MFLKLCDFNLVKLPPAFNTILSDKLEKREQNKALRMLPVSNVLIDFASNDYLGFAKSETIFNQTHHYLLENNIKTIIYKDKLKKDQIAMRQMEDKLISQYFC